MVTPNPATPAQAATPGSSETVVTPPAVAPAPATPAPGINPAGTVTISTEEFAKLQRDAARGRSPKGRTYQRPSSQAINSVDPNDPNASALIEANSAREAAERKAMQLEVKGKVRDLLADERFKNIPASTRKLILDAPHMLSAAETLEDAMYDIEDKLIELSGVQDPSNPNPPIIPPNPANPQPASRETPPIVTPGNPAQIDAGALEPVEGLRGSERSMAVLRNSLKKQHGGVGPTP